MSLLSVPAHGKESAVEEEEEKAVEDQLAAEGLRGRVTMANQLSDRQVKSFIPATVRFWVDRQKIYTPLKEGEFPTVLTMFDGFFCNRMK